MVLKCSLVVNSFPIWYIKLVVLLHVSRKINSAAWTPTSCCSLKSTFIVRWHHTPCPPALIYLFCMRLWTVFSFLCMPFSSPLVKTLRNSAWCIYSDLCSAGDHSHGNRGLFSPLFQSLHGLSALSWPLKPTRNLKVPNCCMYVWLYSPVDL